MRDEKVAGQITQENEEERERAARRELTGRLSLGPVCLSLPPLVRPPVGRSVGRSVSRSVSRLLSVEFRDERLAGNDAGFHWNSDTAC